MEYRGRRHHALPHIVKCSGGRSSAMMTMLALDDGTLKPERGDAVLFTNTGAENADTYAFIGEIFTRCEASGVPCFISEFATCEERHGERWTRVPTYRLTNTHTQTKANPNGFDWRGWVYEELISWSGYLPNVHERTCTAHLKINTARRFVEHWLDGAGAIEERGHRGPRSRIDPDQAHARHRAAGGTLSLEHLIERRRFVWARPTGRARQLHTAFSANAQQCSAHARATHAQSKGTGDAEYVTLIGLRGDEWMRTARVLDLARSNREAPIEHPYVPLYEAGIDAEAVRSFWSAQDFDLATPPEIRTGNCVYCFLKGDGHLRRIKAHLDDQQRHGERRRWPEDVLTPCDWQWWIGIEKRYARDLAPSEGCAEHNLPSTAEDTGAASYARLFTEGAYRYEGNGVLPCDCTD